MKAEELIAYNANLERILDNLKEGIIAHDLDRRIFFFNKAAEAITGYSKAEVLGIDCHVAMGGPFCGNRCHFCGDRPRIDQEIRDTHYIKTKQGEFRCIDMIITGIHDENGNLAGVLASFTDVTTHVNLTTKAEKLQGFCEIIGTDPAMLAIFQQVRNIARYDYPIHISGETGTGKELIAAAVHAESHRSAGPFVPINCGALPEGLIESELFGHVKGSFTGAVRDKKGRFELADGGTIFLDEVADLSKPVQVKLLRFLQEGEFDRVGGEKTVSVDVRIMSATNKDLKEEVRQNRFREDLYYRLNVIPIHLPPLRHRKGDIPLLVHHFLMQAVKRYNQPMPVVSPEAMALMINYHWPGNVRELQNTVQFAFVQSKNGKITASSLPIELHRKTLAPDMPIGGKNRKLTVEATTQALISTRWNKVKAAQVLGVGRATLYRFLEEHPEIRIENAACPKTDVSSFER